MDEYYQMMEGRIEEINDEFAMLPQMDGCELNSCADIGRIDLTLTASDDRTPAEDVGYKLRFASGERPDADLRLPEEPVHSPMTLYWGDGASDIQESFDFFLEIAAVDRAGNTGPWTLIEIADAGSGCGCRVRGGGTASLGVFVLGLGLLGLLRRRWRGAEAPAKEPRTLMTKIVLAGAANAAVPSPGA